ncbi:MAG: hypothetical protein J7K96_08655, partial [Desulfobacteraceae bacterium]|nr:hypothetical protein [Desulfobacteraceae bacterium]
TFLSLRGRHDQSNLFIDRGLLCRSFLTPRNDKQNLKVSVQALVKKQEFGFKTRRMVFENRSNHLVVRF